MTTGIGLSRRTPGRSAGRDAALTWREVCASDTANRVLSVSTRSSRHDHFEALLSQETAVGEEGAFIGVDPRPQSDRCSCGFEIEGAQHVYNEEAFRYFLEIERIRSERSGYPFLLLLVDLRATANGGSEIDELSSSALFAGGRWPSPESTRPGCCLVTVRPGTTARPRPCGLPARRRLTDYTG